MWADIQNGIIVTGDDTKNATTPRGVAAFFCARAFRDPIATAALHVISIAAVSIGKKPCRAGDFKSVYIQFLLKVLFGESTFG